MSILDERVSGSGGIVVATAVCMAVWVAILLGLFPASEVDTLPPECSVTFGNVVACRSQEALLGLAIGGARFARPVERRRQESALVSTRGACSCR